MMSSNKPAKSNPGLSQASVPILNRQNGDRLMAMTELDQLEEKRRKLQSQLDEVESQVLALKTRRREELLEELRALGLDEVPEVGGNGAGGRKGRPRGFKMSDEHKQRMKEGRQRARDAKALAPTTNGA